ncbi:MAG: hypothetical protein ACN2B6_11945 [Rickettsiales bacterium]
MADPTAANSLTTMAAGAVGTAIAAKESMVANSLLQANFEQLIAGQFHLQLGDVISIIGVSLLIWGAIKEFRKGSHAKENRKADNPDR